MTDKYLEKVFQNIEQENTPQGTERQVLEIVHDNFKSVSNQEAIIAVYKLGKANGRKFEHDLHKCNQFALFQWFKSFLKETDGKNLRYSDFRIWLDHHRQKIKELSTQ